MGAIEILHKLRERGLSVEPGQPGRLIVRPASKLSDDLRAQIREQKAEIIDRLAAEAAAAPAPTCADPVSAGLADRFHVIWLDLIDDQGATCLEHQAREQRQPHDDLPRLTPEQVRAVIGWNENEIAQAERYMRQTDRHGFDVDMSERITDQLMLRDRRGDDRRMCLECAHLDRSGRCRAARSGRLPEADRDLQPIKVVLMRCPEFRSPLNSDPSASGDDDAQPHS